MVRRGLATVTLLMLLMALLFGIANAAATDVMVKREVLTMYKVPVLLCWRKGGVKLPVAFAVHWSGGSKEGMQGIGEDLARSGFLAVLPDVRTFGERTGVYASSPSFLSLLDDSAKEVSAIIDVLKSDKRADTHRVGITGISLGGLITHAAIVRDKRIGAAAPIAGSPDWQFLRQFGSGGPGDSVTAELIRRSEPLSHPGRYYPCALLMLHGKHDATVPIDGSRRLQRDLAPYYPKDPARLKLTEYDDGHNIGSNSRVTHAAVEWLARWLTR